MIHPDNGIIMGSNPCQFDRVKSSIRAFFNQAAIRAPMDYLCNALPKRAELYVAGGAIRNIIIGLLHGASPPTVDIDLFVANIRHHLNLNTILREQRIERTDLGGLRWYPQASTYCFDISRLLDFLVINKYQLEATRANLLGTIDFDVNAVVYDFKRQELYEHHCLAAIAAKTMRFNTRMLADKTLLVFRVLNIRHKIEFTLGEDIFLFLKTTLDIDTLIQVKALMMQKLGRPTTQAVLKDLNRICVHKNYQTYCKAIHP
ncbi:hypothetical protein ACFL5W_01390 [Thermodesulfobacteriota bacterium]